MDDNKFGKWKVSGSFLWIHGKREHVLLVMIPVISLTIWVSQLGLGKVFYGLFRLKTCYL